MYGAVHKKLKLNLVSHILILSVYSDYILFPTGYSHPGKRGKYNFTGCNSNKNQMVSVL